MHDVCTLDPCDTIAQSVVSSMLFPQSTVFWTFQRQFAMVQCHVSSSQQAVLGTLYGLVQTLVHGWTSWQGMAYHLLSVPGGKNWYTLAKQKTWVDLHCTVPITWHQTSQSILWESEKKSKHTINPEVCRPWTLKDLNTRLSHVSFCRSRNLLVRCITISSLSIWRHTQS